MSLRFVPTPFAASALLAGLAAARAGQEERRVPSSAADAFIATGAARGNLDALLSGRALAVTTGQQAGLFTGPLYTVLKALTASAMAQRLQSTWARPIVPVFWVAGDDHDFAEIAGCHVIAQDGTDEAIVLRERAPDARMLPAFREPLEPGIAAAFSRLEALLPPSEFRSGVVDWLRRAYAPGRSMAEAHAEALSELLADHGVVVLRGWHGALKRAAADVLLGALGRAEALDAALAEEAAALGRAGQEVPVEVGHGLSLVMLEGAAGRDRLRTEAPGRFVTRRSAEAFTGPDLERILREEPERLSANVLLRPVVEASVVPTVVYVGGPGELAYLAQTRPLFGAFGVPRPAAAPRLSGMLIDGRADKTLERLGLEPGDLARPEHELAADVLRDALPAPAAEALSALRRALEEGFGALGREAAGIDKTLERSVESARNQALGASQEIEKKLLAALKRTSDTAFQQLVRARAALFPRGEPQERVHTIASFTARYGGEVLDVLGAAGRDHAARLLEGNLRET
ncbi:MAG: bacillithiol biosynthesis cysteine-adding enzyme BshC [Gemmatimonadota bacterium]